MQNPWRKVVHRVSFFLFFQTTRATFKFSATFTLHEQSVGLEPNLPSQAHMGLGEIFCMGGESGWQVHVVDSSQGFAQNREKEPLDMFNTLRYFKINANESPL